MDQNKLKLSAPWYIYVRELRVLFGKDPGINIVFDEDNLEVKLYVEDPEKAEAISQLLPCEQIFGAVSLKISVVPGNNLTGAGRAALYSTAFKGNPIFSHCSEFQGLYNQPITHVVFKKEIAQYFSDDLGTEQGITSVLYQDVARDLIGLDGVCFSTEVEPDQVIRLEK